MIDIQEFLGGFSIVSFLLYILKGFSKIICMAISQRSPPPPQPQNSSTLIEEKEQERGRKTGHKADHGLEYSSELVSDYNVFDDHKVMVKDTMIRLSKRPSKLLVPEICPGDIGLYHEPQKKMERKEVLLEETNYCLATKQGKRDLMEDAHGVFLNVFKDPKQAIFVVIDGHGGRAAADFVAEHLGKNIVEAVGGEAEEETFRAAMEKGYLTTDKDFLSKGITGGACATSAFFGNGYLHVANLGDCRAVLSRKGEAHVLTNDHRLTREDERLRVETSGGYVQCRNGVWRVNGSLAVSRAIGDLQFKPYVISQPEICRFPLTANCEFLILASDGLWDKVCDQEAVDVISTTKSLIQGCKKLVDLSCMRGNIDDITVMVINVQPFATPNFRP